jgi:cell division protein FtsB
MTEYNPDELQSNAETPEPQVQLPEEQRDGTEELAPADETGGALPPANAPEPEKQAEQATEKKPPSRFQRFLRKFLIGLAIVAVIFLAGFLTNHFVRYRPLVDTLEETQTELTDARQSVSDLEAEIVRLKRLNQTAQDEIDDLEAELAAAKTNAHFYQVLVDVNAARIALFLEDLEGAEAALAETQEKLADLQPAISATDPDLALSLPRRLELIVSGMARDPETAHIDLELFTRDLLALEPQLSIE